MVAPGRSRIHLAVAAVVRARDLCIGRIELVWLRALLVGTAARGAGPRRRAGAHQPSGGRLAGIRGRLRVAYQSFCKLTRPRKHLDLCPITRTPGSRRNPPLCVSDTE